MKLKSTKPIMAILLIITIFFFVNISYYGVSKMVEEECLDRLFTAAVVTEKLMTDAFEKNYKVLENISNLLLNTDNTASNNFFSIYESLSDLLVTDRIHLLLPNGDDYHNDGTVTNVAGKVSFDNESLLGKHISKRITSAINDDEQIVRQFFPIEKDGETLALLYATIVCNNFSKFITQVDAFQSAHYSIVERNTGNYIYDDSHSELSNINNFRNRNIPDDKAYSKSIDAILGGEKGYKKIKSADGKSYSFITYIPSNINDWTFIAVVDQAEIMKKLSSFHKQLILFCFLSVVLFMIYLYFSHRENLRKRKTAEEKFVHIQQRNDGIISALSNDFGSIFYVDVEKDKIIPCRINDKNEVKKISEKLIRIDSYTDALSSFVTSYVQDDEKFKILYGCSLENLKRQFSKHQSLVYTFLNNENRYFLIKLARTDYVDGNFKSFVIGIADKDELFRNEKK